MIKGVPVFDEDHTEKPLLGAIFTMRDSSGEIVLQAKYHKLKEALEQREDQILVLEEKLSAIRRSRKV